jgi:type I restriction enzyme S subunit
VSWRRCRLDWLTSEERGAVNPTEISADTVFHYSIPALDEIGDGRLEHPDEIGSGKLLLSGGEVLISKLNPRLPRVLLAEAHDVPTLASTEFIALRPGPNVDERFLRYWLGSEPLRQMLNGATMSVTRSQQRVRPEIVTKSWLRVPSIDDQRAIADYLDRETARIDALIEKKQALIDALGQRRSAVITLAISRGIDMNAPLRSSGVEWLGQVPAHWDVLPVKRLGRATIGLTYSPEEIVNDSSLGTLVLRAGNIQDGRIALNDNVYVSTPIPPSLRLLEDDILICSRNGSASLIGKNALVPAELAGQTWGAFMTVLRSDVNDYLRWVLSSSIFERQLGLFATSTINQLTSAMLHDMYLPVPPRDEQQRIACHLEDSTGEIDVLIYKTHESIDLTREHRQALITAAVTGELESFEVVA